MLMDYLRQSPWEEEDVENGANEEGEKTEQNMNVIGRYRWCGTGASTRLTHRRVMFI